MWLFSKSRKVAIEQAIEENYNIVILDDGFQDEEIKKDISILCFSSAQSIGNGLGCFRGSSSHEIVRLVCATCCSTWHFIRIRKGIFWCGYLRCGLARFWGDSFCDWRLRSGEIFSGAVVRDRGRLRQRLRGLDLVGRLWRVVFLRKRET